MTKIYEFTNGKERYLSLADRKADDGDLCGALSMLYSALELSESDAEIYGDIADIYADMELYELSNKFWFKYLSVVSKEKAGVGYEELGINYFCMQNLFVSSYYFHKKVLTDGFISQDNITEEMAEMFSDSLDLKKAYRIVYPFDKADYSKEMVSAKHAFVVGDYATAIRLYSEIPPESRQHAEAASELALVYFLTGNDDKAIQLTKESIEKYGESTALFCNLSSMYKQKGNDDKSAYYYNRAKEIYNGDKEGLYKLSTCALEQGDTETAIAHFEKVTAERPYEVNLNYLYALALANDGDYVRAHSVMRRIYGLKPHDEVLSYYVKLFSDLCDGISADDLFPLEYVNDLPKSVRQKKIRRIDQIFSSDLSKISKKINSKEVLSLFSWGLARGSERTAKKCIYILTQTDSSKGIALLKEKLIDPETDDEVKRAVIFMLVLSGKVKKIPAVVKDFYMVIKPRELPCKKAPDGMIFYAAYALCLSRIIFGEASDFDKIAFATDKVYKKLAPKIGEDFDKETIAALIVYVSKLDKVPSVKDLCTLFETKKEDFETLMMLYKGENDA